MSYCQDCADTERQLAAALAKAELYGSALTRIFTAAGTNDEDVETDVGNVIAALAKVAELETELRIAWEDDPELVDLRSQLHASEAECERLRREAEDVRKLDEWKEHNAWRGIEEWFETAPGKVYVVRVEAHGRVTGDSFPAARRAAVEYLEKKEKADE